MITKAQDGRKLRGTVAVQAIQTQDQSQSGFERVELLGVAYHNVTMAQAVRETVRLTGENQKSAVFFLNADCLYKAKRDRTYCRILNEATLVLPDGIGLKLASRLFGHRMRENCNGTDFSPQLLSEAARTGLKVFFLGGKRGVAEEAAINARKRFPGVQIVGTHSGYFDRAEDVILKINASAADVLFVAFGVSLQEKWIMRYRDNLDPKLCLGVGAFLDFLSGRIPRAPRLFRFLHLEWFWRMLMEPKRMIKRYLIDGSRLFFHLLVSRLKHGR